MIKSGDRKLGLENAWLAPFETKVLGGLRGKINQFSDGSGTTLTPKSAPKIKRSGSNTIELGAEPVEAEAAVCVPVTSANFNYIPFDSPLNLATNYTFQASYTPLATATAPLSYEFKLNGATQQIGASDSWGYTLVDGDIHSKDGGGLGVISVEVIVRNACNVTGSSDSEDIPAQGNP